MMLKNYKNISAEAFQSQLTSDPQGVLLDVRTLNEFQIGYIPGSLLVDINGPGFLEEVKSMDRAKHYYIYCRSGARSAKACSIMADLGFKSLHNLIGGIEGWPGDIVSSSLDIQNQK